MKGKIGGVIGIGIEKGVQPRVAGHVSWGVLVLSFAVLVLVLDNRNMVDDEVAIGARFDGGVRVPGFALSTSTIPRNQYPETKRFKVD